MSTISGEEEAVMGSLLGERMKTKRREKRGKRKVEIRCVGLSHSFITGCTKDQDEAKHHD